MGDNVITPALVIDVISDVVCPWCYIGKRKLEAALAELRKREPEVELTVRWHPFQLNPDLPASGIPRALYLEGKFGGARRAAEIYARVRAAGAEVGLSFEFDRIMLQPNTLDAHRLIAWSQQSASGGKVDDLVERLFRAYFIEGRFVGKDALFNEKGSDYKIGTIPDGTSNTALVVEGGDPVIWSRPAV